MDEVARARKKLRCNSFSFVCPVGDSQINIIQFKLAISLEYLFTVPLGANSLPPTVELGIGDARYRTRNRTT